MKQLIKTINEKLYLSSEYIVEKGMNRRTLANYISMYNKGQSLSYSFIKNDLTSEKWISFESIPLKILRKFNIPISKNDLTKEIESLMESESQKKQREIWLILSNAWNNPTVWRQYVPSYSEYYLDKGKRTLFAKTHSLFNNSIIMKKSGVYSLINIHKVYLKFKEAIFWTDKYDYFTKKIKFAQDQGITDTLLHDFKKFGRNNYRLTPLVKKRIIFYYVNPKKYSRKQITEMVNLELIERGLKSISYQSVTLFLRNNEFKNRHDILRNGKEYAYNKLFPYITRKEPEHIASLYQIDSTRLNLPYNGDDGKIRFIYLCVIMDVFTRKIIGHSFSQSENHLLIINCLKMALEEFKYIPKQIVVDNHSSYSSNEFNSISSKMEDYGVCVRKSKPYNPRDKGHVERWFKTFSSYYLNRLIGNLGFGIKSKLEDSRAAKSLERFYLKPKNLRSKKQLCELVSKLISQYNVDVQSKRKTIINKAPKKFAAWQIAHIFYKNKKIKIRNSMLIMRVVSRHTYTIHNILMAEKLNNTYVIVRYDENDPSNIYLFNIKSNQYLGCLKVDVPIDIIPSSKDLVRIKKHNENIRKRIQSSFDKIVNDIDDGEIELESLPILVEENLKEKYAKTQSEDKFLISEMIKNGIPEKRNKEIYKNKNKLHMTDKYYRKVKRQKFKLIK